MLTLGTKEEAEPCGVAGALSFHYSVGMGRKPVPDISDVLAVRRKPSLLTIWEPLQTKAPRPPKARAYCCYSNTIIFYHAPYIVWPFPKVYRSGGRLKLDSGPTFAEWDQIKTRFNSHHDIVLFEGERFAFTGATVLWKKRRWWMRYGARIVKDER